MSFSIKILKSLAVAAGLLLPAAAIAQTMSLDSCRQLAMRNNKQLRMAKQAIQKAEYQKKEAFAAYLPGIDFAGGYMYNQRNISIFDSDQMLPVKNFDLATQSYQYKLVTNPLTGEPIKGPNGQYVPEQVALIPKEAMEFDIHNTAFGAITLTQPVYMGGKIVAMNKITKFAEEAAKRLHDAEAENIIYAVDGVYWQVVSLKAKESLAESYIALLDTLHNNVSLMIEQGIATRSDLLTVDVKLNSAQVDLVKVRDGLSLSRMALAQLCGLPIHEPIIVADEGCEFSPSTAATLPASSYSMTDVYARRNDLQALEIGVKVAEQQSKVAMSSMLPNLAVVGAYSFSNPNMFDGFKKNFKGAFSVGAMLTVPLWHWGGNYNKYRAAKADTEIARLRLEDAREMVDLQVNQASFKASEAVKTYEMSCVNIAKADENLRQAGLGFREGVMTVQNVMEAQTAWLKARSEKIDAEIDVHLCDVYLSKVLGTLNY